MDHCREAPRTFVGMPISSRVAERSWTPRLGILDVFVGWKCAEAYPVMILNIDIASGVASIPQSFTTASLTISSSAAAIFAAAFFSKSVKTFG